MNYGFVIDNRKCIGCHACTVACKSEHQVPLGVNRTWVKYIEKGVFPDTRRNFTVMRCNHCEEAPCVEICPVGALFFREDGIVDFNQERCIGCKSCTQACPYNAIYINPETETAAKCNYCAHRIDVGMRPACVNVCPQEAIISGDMDDPHSEITKLITTQSVQARKVEKNTVPKLYYINGDAAALNPLAAPPQAFMIQTSQAAGVGHYAKYAKKRINENPPIVLDGEKAPYENERPEDYGVTIPHGGDASKMEKYAWNVVKENARRTLDAPQKGILWGWELPAYLWSKSVASGLFFFTALGTILNLLNATSALFSGITSLIFVALTAAFLIKDLDRPDRFHYVILRPQNSSWLVRGGNIMTLFGVFVTVYLAALFLKMNDIATYAAWAGAILAVPFAGYTAFLLAQAKGRDFWQSPVLPLHMVTHGVVAGAGALAILGLVVEMNSIMSGIISTALVIGILVDWAILFAELAIPHPTLDSKMASKMILKGHFSSQFWFWSVLIGGVVPMALLLFGAMIGLPVSVILPATGVMVLIGVYVTEHIWVRAPQLIPLS